MLDTGYGFIGEDGVERVSPEEVWEAEAEDEGKGLMHPGMQPSQGRTPAGAVLYMIAVLCRAVKEQRVQIHLPKIGRCAD